MALTPTPVRPALVPGVSSTTKRSSRTWQSPKTGQIRESAVAKRRENVKGGENRKSQTSANIGIDIIHRQDRPSKSAKQGRKKGAFSGRRDITTNRGDSGIQGKLTEFFVCPIRLECQSVGKKTDSQDATRGGL